MALTQLQRVELNKRVDRIFHAPSNAPANGRQPEIAFVTQMSGNRNAMHSSVKDAVASLKAHDKMFQNMRSNMVYWYSDTITSKVTPMSFILMGRAFEEEAARDCKEITDTEKRDKTRCDTVDITEEIVDKFRNFEDLCAYLKLYHARCRCILVFVDCTFAELEERNFDIANVETAMQHLNPFLKYRLLVIARDKMVTGSELLMQLISSHL
ncbi:MAG: hypothetical protein K2O40_02335 [Lachnospiraceae bacterium]|nr:hypothetical protein [Lachnospiraceae bacterium]MDE7183315.1 hypothetical protein [Lachnospiraceae bacterium]